MGAELKQGNYKYNIENHMKQNYLLIGIGVGLLLILIGLYLFKSSVYNGELACTQEAKICPNGLAVGRTGINCEFAPCVATETSLSASEARAIAEKTCIKSGESLAGGVYNENSKTWWFDANLNTDLSGCRPSCVVSEKTKTAEINWRCTGLKELK